MGKNRESEARRKAAGGRHCIKKKKNRQRPQAEQGVVDYRRYSFTGKDRLRMAAEYLALSGGISYLFYRSLPAMLLFWLAYPFYRRRKRRSLIRQRQDKLCHEFKDAIQYTAASLAAGYSIENAFRETHREMLVQYGAHALMTEELRYINHCVSVNIPLEQLLHDFANRSGLEDVRSFCEVFSFAKRSGGDFIRIIRLTAERIMEKNELMEEIQTEIAGRKMEQTVMNLMPLFILLYVDVSFGGYLETLYHNAFGIAVMSVCLAVYFGAFLLSEKIMDIQI